jgi:methyltransferase
VTIAALTIVIVGFMLLEARRAEANERWQRARGGIAPPEDLAVYAAMRVAYPAAFASMLFERALRGDVLSDAFVLGAALYIAAKALKWWAILELGPFWTFRVIVVPGARLVRSGPYRYMRHPNYLGVFGELVGTALMCGAMVTGPIATLLFTSLMVWRSTVEHRALDAAR